MNRHDSDISGVGLGAREGVRFALYPALANAMALVACFGLVPRFWQLGDVVMQDAIFAAMVVFAVGTFAGGVALIAGKLARFQEGSGAMLWVFLICVPLSGATFFIGAFYALFTLYGSL